MDTSPQGQRLAPLAEKATAKTRLALAIVLAVALLLAGFKFLQALELASHEKFDTYVSDEVWYVTSSRTIAYEVLGITPRYTVNGTLGYTVFAATDKALEQARERALSMGGIVIKDDYKEVKAIAVGLPPNVPADALSGIDGVEKVIPGYPYADKKNIHNYYNLEHPPLGKYIIALTMAVGEDRPLNWRLPGMLEAALIVVIVALAGFRLMGLAGGLIAAAAAGLDPLTTRLATVAMLDIHLAFFTALAGLCVVYRRWGLALAFTGLAGMVKYSGYFILPGLYVALRLGGWRPRKALAGVVAAVAATALLVYAPFLGAFGPYRMATEFINALKWHTTSRPEGPATSTPLDWVLGWNPFYLHLDPDVPARGSPIVYVPVFIVLLLSLPGLFSRRVRRGLEPPGADLMILIGSFMAGFLLVYIMGNRTLYSFYMTQAAPLFYMALPTAAAVLVARGWVIGESVEEGIQLARDWLEGGLGRRRPPAELGFAWKLLYWDSTRSRTLFWIVAAVAVFSLVAHWDVGQDVKLFSDAPWMVWEEGAPSVEPGRLSGLQGLLALLFSALNVHGNYLLLVDFAALLLFANEARILLGHLERRGFRVRFYFYPLVATLMVYGVYDGSGVSLFLFSLGVNLWLEGRKLPAGLSLGLSAGNPLLLVFLPLFYALRDRGVLGGMALSMVPVNGAVALSLGVERWLTSLAEFLEAPKTAGVALLLPPQATVLLLALAVASSLLVSLKVRCRLTALASSLMVFTALFPNPLPQWLVVLAPFTLLAGRRLLAPILSVDVLNSLIVFLWFSTEELMRELFKLETQGPLDPLSAPALAAYLRSIALAVWAYRTGFARGGSVERCQPTSQAG